MPGRLNGKIQEVNLQEKAIENLKNSGVQSFFLWWSKSLTLPAGQARHTNNGRTKKDNKGRRNIGNN